MNTLSHAFFVYFHVKNLEKFNILDLGSIWQFYVENVLNGPSAKGRKWSTTLFVLKNTDFIRKRCIYSPLWNRQSFKLSFQLDKKAFERFLFDMSEVIIYKWFFNIIIKNNKPDISENSSVGKHLASLPTIPPTVIVNSNRYSLIIFLSLLLLESIFKNFEH